MHVLVHPMRCRKPNRPVFWSRMKSIAEQRRIVEGRSDLAGLCEHVFLNAPVALPDGPLMTMALADIHGHRVVR